MLGSLLKWGLLTVVSAAAVLLLGNFWVLYSTSDALYDDMYEVPDSSGVALVLGTSRSVNGRLENLFFTYRINTAARLYHIKKVRHIVVSGDNSNHRYNEPLDMKKALKALGVPDTCITMDFGGRRTLDSIVRLRDIFGQKKCLIVSQGFHTPRAVFLARCFGLEAAAVNASFPERGGQMTIVREWGARIKAILDVYLLKTRPAIMGKPEPLETS
jgi:SanA protein